MICTWLTACDIKLEQRIQQGANRGTHDLMRQTTDFSYHWDGDNPIAEKGVGE